MDAIAAEIVRRHSEEWTWELLSHLLETGIAPVREFYKAPPAPAFAPVRSPLDHYESENFLLSHLDLLGRWVAQLKTVIDHELGPAVGASGQPGDAAAIEAAAGKIVLFCERLIEWEQAWNQVLPASHWADAFELVRGTTRPLFEEIERFACKVAAIPEFAARGGTHVDLRMTFPVPQWSGQLEREIKHAVRTGGSFIERHPILSGIFGGALLSHLLWGDSD
jgi:hypothetical protein